jgi:hypothetical protein
MASTAWIWWLSGGVLALTGLTLLWWSLCRDRSRSRRRCPKCWYDMAGVPGLVCPECGRDARRERRLSKTRRRWRWAALGGLVTIIAFSLAVTPRVRLYGPASLLPTTVLLWASPTIEQTWTTSDNKYLARLENHHDGMMIELSRRASSRAASLADWQWRYWIERKHVVHAWRHPDDPTLVFVQIEVPAPLCLRDSLSVCTVPAPGWDFVGPVQIRRDQDLGEAEHARVPGTTTTREPGFAGWESSFLIPILLRARGGLGPFRTTPSLDARLEEAAADELLLDVTYSCDAGGSPNGVPPVGNVVVIWSGRARIKISDQAPPWHAPASSFP